MPAPTSKIMLNVDGSAWFSGPPDPTTFQQANANRVYLWDGSASVEPIAIWLWDGFQWIQPAPPAYPSTMLSQDTTFCTTGPAHTHYQVGLTLGGFAADHFQTDSRGFKSTTGNSGYTMLASGFPVTFTEAEGDNGTCWGYYQVRVRSRYSDWSAWSDTTNRIHLPVTPCGRPI
jgi:hypothetical protein